MAFVLAFMKNRSTIAKSEAKHWFQFASSTLHKSCIKRIERIKKHNYYLFAQSDLIMSCKIVSWSGLGNHLC